MLDNTTNKAINKPSVSGVSDVETLTAGDSYTWYVGAVSTNGSAISWSDQTFSVSSPTLAPPTQFGPSGTIPAGVNFDTPTFSWSATSSANHYYLYVLDTTTNQPVVNLSFFSGTSYSASALTPGHDFTWYIGAETTNGVNGPIAWSAETFALAALTAPTPLAPVGTVSAAVVSTTPTFSWSSVPGAAHYYLYLVDDTTNQVLINNANVSGTTFTSTPTLTTTHRYTWYIAAEGANGGDVTFSGPLSFTLVS